LENHQADILTLIAARRGRRPAAAYPALDELFRRLAACRQAEEAFSMEERIWHAWMHHPHRAAATVLDAVATFPMAAIGSYRALVLWVFAFLMPLGALARFLYTYRRGAIPRRQQLL